MPDRPTKSATAAAAVATVSMRLGKLSSVVSTATTLVHDLSESHCARTLAAFYYPSDTYQESDGVTRWICACQERPFRLATKNHKRHKTSPANSFSAFCAFLWLRSN